MSLVYELQPSVANALCTTGSPVMLYLELAEQDADLASSVAQSWISFQAALDDVGNADIFDIG